MADPTTDAAAPAATPPQAPVSTGPPPAAPNINLEGLMKAKLKDSAQEFSQAQGQRDQIRKKAAGMLPWISALAGEKAAADHFDQIIQLSNQPMKDWATKQGLFDQAVHQAMETGKLQAADYQNAQNADLNSPLVKAKQKALAVVGKQLGWDEGTVSKLNGFHTDWLGSQIPGFSEALEKQAKAGTDIATAGKTAAETKEIPAGEAAKRAKEYAETGKLKAETKQVQLKTGSDIYEGVSRGSIPLSETEEGETRKKLTATDEALNSLDRVQDILGKARMETDLKKRAAIETNLVTLTAKMMESEGFKRLTEVDKDFFGPKFFGNPNAVKNLLTDQAQTKLSEARHAISADAIAHIRGRDLRMSEARRAKYESGGPIQTIPMRTPKGKVVHVPANEVKNAPRGWALIGGGK